MDLEFYNQMKIDGVTTAGRFETDAGNNIYLYAKGGNVIGISDFCLGVSDHPSLKGCRVIALGISTDKVSIELDTRTALIVG